MNIAVYLGSSTGSDPVYQKTAEELGAWIGDHGHTLIYGGSQSGTMGTLAYAALSHHAQVIGVMPQFLIDRGRAEIELSKMITVKTMDERKAEMMKLSDVSVALPGGPGTIEEISEVISAIRLHITNQKAFLLNINGYYEPLREMYQKMIQEGFLNADELKNVLYVSSICQLEEYL